MNDKPNIILVLLDGARFDRLHISDKFSELTNKGFLLNNVTSAIPYTIGALNVIFTGLYGKENGVDAYYKMFKLKNNVEYLPEILQKNGYYTSCKLISKKILLPRGFDIHSQYNEYKIDPNEDHPKFLENMFQNANGKPLFAFLQFSKIHTATANVLKKYDWDNKLFYENKKNNLKSYDKSFFEAGNYADLIYAKLKEMKKIKNTIIVFFSDHGTGIGERFGERNYGSFTYEETIRTFCLFLGSNIKKKLSSNNLLSAINFFPTILQLCDINFKQKTCGKSFVKLLEGKKHDVLDKFTFSETGALEGPYPSPKKPNVFCIKSKNYKLIYLQTPNEWRFYNLKNDPHEEKNLHYKNLDTEKKFKEKLLDWINRK